MMVEPSYGHEGDRFRMMVEPSYGRERVKFCEINSDNVKLAVPVVYAMLVICFNHFIYF